MRKLLGVLFLLNAAVSGVCQVATKVSLCEIKQDPAAFNQQLVQVSVFVSHGFEEFSALDPECEFSPEVWIEYGGKTSSGTVFCCGATENVERGKNIKLEGIEIPLVRNDRFLGFDKLLRAEGDTMIHATLVGRFFAGQRIDGGNWRGYGHMGCCSLFVLQEVIESAPHTRPDLDYGSSYDQPDLSKLKCGSYTDLLFTFHRFRSILREQESAESDRAWVFEDPERVARESLARLQKVDAATLGKAKLIRSSQGRNVFEFSVNRRPRFMVVVSKPYWLSFYAQDSTRVAWVPTAAYLLCR